MSQVKCRKLKTELECPVDNLLYYLVQPISTICKKLNITPNMITSISIVFGILAIYFLYKNKFLQFTIMFCLYYLLDIVDGYHARKYNMCSKLGDYYDHTRDAIILTSVSSIILYRFYKLKMWKSMGIFIASIISFQIHMSCQELHIDDIDINHQCHSETLAFLNFCKSKKWINFTRYFGMGTFIFIIIIFVYIQKQKNLHIVRK